MIAECPIEKQILDRQVSLKQILRESLKFLLSFSTSTLLTTENKTKLELNEHLKSAWELHSVLPESLSKKQPNFRKPQNIYIKALVKIQNIYIKGLSKGKNIYIKAQRERAKISLKSVFIQIFKSSQKRSQKGQVTKKENFGSQMV